MNSIASAVGVESTVISLDETLEFTCVCSREFTGVSKFNKFLTEQSTYKSLTTVRDCIEGDFRHVGYLEYLGLAWNSHLGIVFTPDVFWQLFLTEIAAHIKDNSELYRHLFTDLDKKTEIIVPTDDSELINLNLIMDHLSYLVPTDTDVFIPEFSTTTPSSSLAFKAAFADAMSPYYNYSMYLCGIPRVNLLGNVEDWNGIVSRIESLGRIIELPSYFKHIKNLVKRIKDSISVPDVDFWKDIFYLDKCGSGSQVEVGGWVTDFYIEKPTPGYIQNYPSTLSFVSYKNLTTQKEFELCYGLLSSKVEDEYLIPEFGFIINEKNVEVVSKDDKEDAQTEDIPTSQ